MTRLNDPMTASPQQPVISSGTFTLGADGPDPLTVRRLGFGAMRITGAGIWGDPPDHDTAIAVLRRAVELGVDFIDTADAYGPDVSEDLIREALHPYDDVIIATKGGLTRQGPDQWEPVGRPPYLRQCVQMSLRRLGVERIDLWQLHRIDPHVPMDEQFGEIANLQREGLIRHVGLSEVSVDDVRAASEHFEVVSVQNLYNVGARSSEELLQYSQENGIGFIPWFPLGRPGPARRRQPAHGDRRAARCDSRPGRARVAAPALSRPAADPGDGLAGASRGELRRRARPARRPGDRRAGHAHDGLGSAGLRVVRESGEVDDHDRIVADDPRVMP